ncbi:hypothetical protein M431DRAFT_500289 [Trichoderma harzianum CBS 226.95]|uniref:Uncharacterized protein n=1 Tax=Trichoderma harzianum CBS 226.95 TaxID=983964 RepID=A0A2T3ZXL7_TRIHA|nr:hypothetical protein M431DRAFT_500289 [Trichoderma harzianum CBS 226.95]PTB49518.1 hypothetical protein M431DRAFT_500289 [Trichoderma harzianum CBS 226.95]
MPLFDTQRPPFCSNQLHAWSDNVEPRMRNRYGEYYERFNTIQIPILGESDYFDNAIEVAKLAYGQEAEFKRIFTERNTKRREKLLSQIAQITSQVIYIDENFPCKDARNTVSEVCQTGCLLDFLRLLKGITYGWEADVAEDAQLNSGTYLNDEIQSSTEKSQPMDDERIHGALDGKADTYHYEIDSDSKGETQLIDDFFYYKALREEQPSTSATFYLGTYTFTRYTTPTSNGTTHNPNVSASDTSTSENQNKKIPTAQGKRKRGQYDEDVIDASFQQAIDGSATVEKPLPNDGYYCVSKRQKLKIPSPLESTSTNLPPQLVTHKGTSRKRSRHKNRNDYDDYDDYDDDQDQGHKHKRRKLETPSIRYVRDPEAAVTKTRLEHNTCRKGKKSSFQMSRSSRPNTRSAKREEPFCELDHSGTKRSV